MVNPIEPLTVALVAIAPGVVTLLASTDAAMLADFSDSGAMVVLGLMLYRKLERIERRLRKDDDDDV